MLTEISTFFGVVAILSVVTALLFTRWWIERRRARVGLMSWTHLVKVGRSYDVRPIWLEGYSSFRRRVLRAMSRDLTDDRITGIRGAR